MTSRCGTCGRFVGACGECGARYCKRCQPMQHEHGWEPKRQRGQRKPRRLRRLLTGRRPLWLPEMHIRNPSRAQDMRMRPPAHHRVMVTDCRRRLKNGSGPLCVRRPGSGRPR
jgi:hypothetical protein